MIVISYSLPKSASTVLFEYTQDLIENAFPENGNEELVRRTEVGAVLGNGGSVPNFEDKNMQEFLSILTDCGPFAVKTHCKLSDNVKHLVETGKAKVTIVHRDPRDVVLSAVDCCKNTANTGFPMFQSHPSLSISWPLVKKMVPRVLEWMEYGNCLVLRYVDLVIDPEGTVAKVAEYLEIPIGGKKIADIVQYHTKHRNHLFNKGKVLRYPDELDCDEIEMLTAGLRDEILALGYEL